MLLVFLSLVPIKLLSAVAKLLFLTPLFYYVSVAVLSTTNMKTKYLLLVIHIFFCCLSTAKQVRLAN